jgi:hypothetical protein
MRGLCWLVIFRVSNSTGSSFYSANSGEESEALPVKSGICSLHDCAVTACHERKAVVTLNMKSLLLKIFSIPIECALHIKYD